MEKTWNFYTAAQLKPQGWLKRQLEIQAEGLGGNLDLVWPDIRDSAWIGGTAEGWERVPYWLDGFIPLAYLLNREDLKARAQKYIDAILAAQRPDGWLCPCPDEKIPTYDTWAVQLIAKTLTVYYDCTGDSRIPDVLYRMLKNYYDLLSGGTIKLFRWGYYRWYECFISLNFLYERYPEEWICDLARILREQGADWPSFTDLWKHPQNRILLETHIVNIGMMLKYEAVTHELLGEKYTDRAEYLYKILTAYNGTPVGTFTGDEHLGGLSPIHGTELCAVVEQMYSFEQLFAHTGDPKWLERLEPLAFNALPATISDDMWAHQYDQLSNQINCIRFSGNPVFTSNSRNAHIFGLEPNYGCCTANFSQGWPKFALSAFMHRPGEVISAVPVPSELCTNDCRITLETEYPFNNSFVYTVDAEKAFTLRVRIPSFARNLTVNGEHAAADGMLTFSVAAGAHQVIRIAYDAEIRLIDRPHDLKTVKCGSLVFSLPIEYEKVMLEYTQNGVERKFPYCDYEYVGKSDWNYAYSDVEFTLMRRGVGEVPFSSENPPVTVQATMTKIPWGTEPYFDTVCAKIPQSTVPMGEAETKELYPYGCAKLRMTEIPLI